MVNEIEELVRQLDDIADPPSRDVAQRLIAAILELHGTGLRRLVEIVKQGGNAPETLLRNIADDSLTGGLLALHGLHPDSIETRVTDTLRKFQAEAEAVTVTEGRIEIRLRTPGRGLAGRVRAALHGACPDAALIEVKEPSAVPFFLPLASLTTR